MCYNPLENRWKESFRSKLTTAQSVLLEELRPYGQPGRMPKTAAAQLATSVALLIELKAQFYKLVTINQVPGGINL